MINKFLYLAKKSYSGMDVFAFKVFILKAVTSLLCYILECYVRYIPVASMYAVAIDFSGMAISVISIVSYTYCFPTAHFISSNLALSSSILSFSFAMVPVYMKYLEEFSDHEENSLPFDIRLGQLVVGIHAFVNALSTISFCAVAGKLHIRASKVYDDCMLEAHYICFDNLPKTYEIREPGKPNIWIDNEARRSMFNYWVKLVLPNEVIKIIKKWIPAAKSINVDVFPDPVIDTKVLNAICDGDVTVDRVAIVSVPQTDRTNHFMKDVTRFDDRPPHIRTTVGDVVGGPPADSMRLYKVTIEPRDSKIIQGRDVVSLTNAGDTTERHQRLTAAELKQDARRVRFVDPMDEKYCEEQAPPLPPFPGTNMSVAAIELASTKSDKPLSP